MQTTPASITQRIVEIRGERVMLDKDLADLYGVETRVLVQAVKRNAGRFPDDFMFKLSVDEFAALRSHSVILKKGRGQHAKSLPHASNEHGALMLGNVLRSPSAVAMSVLIVRAFVQLLAVLANHGELSKQLDQLDWSKGTGPSAESFSWGSGLGGESLFEDLVRIAATVALACDCFTFPGKTHGKRCSSACGTMVQCSSGGNSTL